MATEIIGYSLDDLDLALDVMELETSPGKYCRIEFCTEGTPSPGIIDNLYNDIINTGHVITYPVVTVMDNITVTSFNIRRDLPLETYFWPALIPLLIPLATIGLITFGIVKIDDISKALVPILLITGGILVLTLAIARKPAQAYIERGGKIPYLPATKKRQEYLASVIHEINASDPADLPLEIEGLKGQMMVVKRKLGDCNNGLPWKRLSKEESHLLSQTVKHGNWGFSHSAKKRLDISGRCLVGEYPRSSMERAIEFLPQTEFPEFEKYIDSHVSKWAEQLKVSMPDFGLSYSDEEFFYTPEERIITMPGKMAEIYKSHPSDFDNLLFWVAHEFGHHVKVEKGFKFKTKEEDYVNKLARYLTDIEPIDAYQALYKFLPEVWALEVRVPLDVAIAAIPKDLSLEWLPKTKHDPVKFAESVLTGNMFDKGDLPIYSGSSGLNPLGVPDSIWQTVFNNLGGKFTRIGELYVVSGGEPEAEPGLLPSTKINYVEILSSGETDLVPGTLVALDTVLKENRKMESLKLPKATYQEKPTRRPDEYDKVWPGGLDLQSKTEHTVKTDLKHSIQEEQQAVADYKEREKTAKQMGDDKTAALYQEIGGEEAVHMGEFKDRLEEKLQRGEKYIADSQEFMAQTITDSGWRGKLDEAFQAAIQRVRGK